MADTETTSSYHGIWSRMSGRLVPFEGPLSDSPEFERVKSLMEEAMSDIRPSWNDGSQHWEETVKEIQKLSDPTLPVQGSPFTAENVRPTYTRVSDSEVKVSLPNAGPTRVSVLPDTPAERKQYPIATGCIDYFGDALAEVAHVSFVGNEQHNPGTPLHWDRSKSTDEADAAMRHFKDRGTLDSDGIRHTAKFAWRALALLQKELEGER